MLITADAKALAGVVSAAVRACPAQHRVEVLTHLRLHAAGSGVSIVGTDLDIAVESTVAANIEAEGSTVLPAKRFADLLAGMAGAVTIDTDQRGAAVRNGRSRFKLPALAVEDFPEPLTLNEDAVVWEFTAADIATLKAVASASSDEQTRYYLCGVHFHALDGRLVMVATDGHTLIREHADIAYPDALPPASSCHDRPSS